MITNECKIGCGIIVVKEFRTEKAASRLFLEAFRGGSTLIFGEYRTAQVAAWIVLGAALATTEMIRQNKKSPVGG